MAEESSGQSCGSGFTVKRTYDCATNTITITNVSGRGPLYKVFNHAGKEIDKFVYHGEDTGEKHPHGEFKERPQTPVEVITTDDNGNETKILYILVESCGCCEEIIYDCPPTPPTTPKVTTPPPTTPPVTTPPVTTPPVTTPPLTTPPPTTPCCPPKGEWYWEGDFKPDSSGASGAWGSTGPAGSPGSAIVDYDSASGELHAMAGTWDVDPIWSSAGGINTRLVITADDEEVTYYPDTSPSNGITVEANSQWSARLEHLIVNSDKPSKPPKPPGPPTLTTPPYTVDTEEQQRRIDEQAAAAYREIERLRREAADAEEEARRIRQQYAYDQEQQRQREAAMAAAAAAAEEEARIIKQQQQQEYDRLAFEELQRQYDLEQYEIEALRQAQEQARLELERLEQEESARLDELRRVAKERAREAERASMLEEQRLQDIIDRLNQQLRYDLAHQVDEYRRRLEGSQMRATTTTPEPTTTTTLEPTTTTPRPSIVVPLGGTTLTTPYPRAPRALATTTTGTTYSPEQLRIRSLTTLSPEQLRIRSLTTLSPEQWPGYLTTTLSPEQLRIRSLTTLSPEQLRIRSLTTLSPEQLRDRNIYPYLTTLSPEQLRDRNIYPYLTTLSPEQLRIRSLTTPQITDPFNNGVLPTTITTTTTVAPTTPKGGGPTPYPKAPPSRQTTLTTPRQTTLTTPRQTTLTTPRQTTLTTPRPRPSIVVPFAGTSPMPMVIRSTTTTPKPTTTPKSVVPDTTPPFPFMTFDTGTSTTSRTTPRSPGPGSPNYSDPYDPYPAGDPGYGIFTPHYMYDSNNTAYYASTYQEHEEYKRLGYTHVTLDVVSGSGAPGPTITTDVTEESSFTAQYVYNSTGETQYADNYTRYIELRNLGYTDSPPDRTNYGLDSRTCTQGGACACNILPQTSPPSRSIWYNDKNTIRPSNISIQTLLSEDVENSPPVFMVTGMTNGRGDSPVHVGRVVGPEPTLTVNITPLALAGVRGDQGGVGAAGAAGAARARKNRRQGNVTDSETTLILPSSRWIGVGEPPEVDIIVTRDGNGVITNIEGVNIRIDFTPGEATRGVPGEAGFNPATEARISFPEEDDFLGGSLGSFEFGDGGDTNSIPGLNGSPDGGDDAGGDDAGGGGAGGDDDDVVNHPDPRPGFPGAVVEGSALVQKYKDCLEAANTEEEVKKCLEQYYKELGDEARENDHKADGNIYIDLGLLVNQREEPYNGMVVSFNGKCYKVIDKDAVMKGRKDNEVWSDSPLCTEPGGNGWEECPCCPPATTSPKPTTSTTSTSPKPTTPPVTTPPVTTPPVTTPPVTTPPVTTPPPTTPCPPCCGPPKGKWWYTEDQVTDNQVNPDGDNLRKFGNIWIELAARRGKSPTKFVDSIDPAQADVDDNVQPAVWKPTPQGFPNETVLKDEPESDSTKFDKCLPPEKSDGLCFKLISPIDTKEWREIPPSTHVSMAWNADPKSQNGANPVPIGYEGGGWKYCECCPPGGGTTPVPTTPGTTTSTTSTTSTTPPLPTTSTTTPCCVPECSPPADRLGMWFWDDVMNNYLSPYNGIAEKGAVFWEGPEFEGTVQEKKIAGAMLNNDLAEVQRLFNNVPAGGRGKLRARLMQWAAEYHDEDKRQCYRIHDADWVNQHKETRPSEDITNNGKVNIPADDKDDDLDDDGTADRGLGWEECPCCPCCPPTVCGLCWFYRDKFNNVFVQLRQGKFIPGFKQKRKQRVVRIPLNVPFETPEERDAALSALELRGVQIAEVNGRNVTVEEVVQERDREADDFEFDVEEGTVVVHCCSDPPPIVDGFVDEDIDNAFNEGKEAKKAQEEAEEGVKEAQAELDAATDEWEAGGGEGDIPDRLDQAQVAIFEAQEDLNDANRRVDEARIDWEIANGSVGGPGARGLQGIRHVIADQAIELAGDIWSPQQQEDFRNAVHAELLFQQANPGLQGAELIGAEGNIRRNERGGGGNPRINEVFNELPGVRVPLPGQPEPAIDRNKDIIEPIEAALERRRLIDNNENFDEIADHNKLSEDDIIEGDDLKQFTDENGKVWNPKDELDDVPKNFDKDCNEACRPICFKVIDPDFVNKNPQLNPAIDVLSHVNDIALNPQNKDKPKKFLTKDLEPEDRGLGWEMCECCPCPDIDKGGPPPPPPPPKITIIEVTPEPGGGGGGGTTPRTTPDIPTTRPIVTTTPIVTSPVITTTQIIQTPSFTTICPPDAKGGPRCNVLKW